MREKQGRGKPDLFIMAERKRLGERLLKVQIGNISLHANQIRVAQSGDRAHLTYVTREGLLPKGACKLIRKRNFQDDVLQFLKTHTVRRETLQGKPVEH